MVEDKTTGVANTGVAMAKAHHVGVTVLEPGEELGAVYEGHLWYLLGWRRPGQTKAARRRYRARASKSWLGRHAPGLLQQVRGLYVQVFSTLDGCAAGGKVCAEVVAQLLRRRRETVTVARSRSWSRPSCWLGWGASMRRSASITFLRASSRVRPWLNVPGTSWIVATIQPSSPA